MEYFCCSDIHGFYNEFKRDLEKAGFDINNEEHSIIICGDLFDRGKQANELLDYLLSIPENRLIIVRGNHEDLLEDCLFQINQKVNISQHHWSNGTLDTICQLSGTNKYDVVCGCCDIEWINYKLEKYFSLINRAVNYYEVGDYIFVHGWVPYILQDIHDPSGELSIISKPIIKLDAEKFMWDDARWYNGMKEAHDGVIIPGKTIVCGHFHTGWGHFNIHKEGETQYDNFDIYYDEGVIALDTCSVHSNKVNILKISF